MANTIAAVMRHVRNFFERELIEGEISITGGMVSPVVDAPYVYISGSKYHDGVKAMTGSSINQDNHPSETFTGRMWLLHPPDEFIALCEEIDQYAARNAAGAYVSESLNEYSYQRATDKSGRVIGWQDAFSERLIPYRRMFTGVG